MCELARIAIFTAFSNRVRGKNQLTLLITVNNLFSQSFVRSIRGSFPNAFVNAHAIEDLSAELIQSWEERVAEGSFTGDEFDQALADEIIAKSSVINLDAGLDRTTVLFHIREAKIGGTRTIGEFLHAWSRQTKFHPPTEEVAPEDVVTLSDAAEKELDAAQVLNSATTGIKDPNLCG